MKNTMRYFIFLLSILFLTACDPAATDDDMMPAEGSIDLILEGKVFHEETGEPLSGWILTAHSGFGFQYETVTDTLDDEGAYRLEIGFYSNQANNQGLTVQEIADEKQEYYRFNYFKLHPPSAPLPSQCDYVVIDPAKDDIYYQAHLLDFTAAEPPVSYNETSVITEAASLSLRVELTNPPGPDSTVQSIFSLRDLSYPEPYYHISSGSLFTGTSFETGACAPQNRPLERTVYLRRWQNTAGTSPEIDTMVYRDTVQVLRDTSLLVTF
ncbi:hypothetical protein FUA23_15070 [Neolewinella aurantiaca]|uniref:DUF4377 domain-containing protein n=1 Tax=Neolewinella aurantiaca TaxID=2602767 RepID=A0A5C7FPE2_9BACT|nr:hypothetical protein [Neolewinella aurantiaca]TXF88299.1 hypothetical protein FUA23_15070 [Neolewinella aurantiaca]